MEKPRNREVWPLFSPTPINEKYFEIILKWSRMYIYVNNSSRKYIPYHKSESTQDFLFLTLLSI